MDNDKVIFKNKKLSALYEEVYTRGKRMDNQITNLIIDLQKLVATKADAVSLVPLIASYVKMSIDNDGNLLKMLAIVTKAVERGNQDGGYDITDAERDQLIALAQESVAEKQLKSGKASNKA